MEGNTLGYVHDLQYRQLTAKGENESIKANVYSVIKLTKTVAEFCHKLAGVKEQTAASLIALTETFRRKTAEIRKRPECQSKTFLNAWDSILAEVENEAKDLTDLGQQLEKSVAGPLFRVAERKKNFCKKSFSYRESCQMQISKSEDDLNKRHKDYSEAWYKYNCHEKETLKDHHIAVYHNGHNSFLLQLATVNSMNETHHKDTVPNILDDVETVHEEVNNSLVRYLKQFLGIQKSTLDKLIKRMDNAVESAKKIDVQSDVYSFVKFANQTMHDRSTPFRPFYPPKVAREFKDMENKQLTYLEKSLVVDQFTEPMLKRTAAYSRKRITELESSMQTLQSQINTSLSLLESDVETVDNRDPSIDEVELLQKKNDVRDQRILSNTLKAQMSLFTPVVLDQLGPISEEYAGDIGKPTITIGRPNDTTMLTSKEKPHQFMEHNFLKPAQCHYCKGIIVGLVKQGLKCQRCRMNVHKKCKRKVVFCAGSPKEPHTTRRISSPVVHSNDNSHEHSQDESLYEEIEPEELERIRRASKASIVSQSNSNTDEDYELPQDVKPQRGLSTAALTKSEPSPELPSDLPLCVALFDFDGEESHDLMLQSGDKIQIVAQSSDEWWEGVCNGKRGYFPASYVEKIDKSDVILRILYDFEGEENSDEMAVEQGQIVVLVEDEGNGWTVGKANGKQGAFPSSYMEKL